MGVEQGGRSQIVKINWGGEGRISQVYFLFRFVVSALFWKKTKNKRTKTRLKTENERREEKAFTDLY